jgi:hypothetical protein
MNESCSFSEPQLHLYAPWLTDICTVTGLLHGHFKTTNVGRCYNIEYLAASPAPASRLSGYRVGHVLLMAYLEAEVRLHPTLWPMTCSIVLAENSPYHGSAGGCPWVLHDTSIKEDNSDREIKVVCRTLFLETLIRIRTGIFPVHIQNILLVSLVTHYFTYTRIVVCNC